jgi:hypothetical protein
MNSLRWLDRPYMPDGNPSYTYMVELPGGGFSVQIGYFHNTGVHPFEVWINGSEAPRGLGAIAKTLSADMRAFDKGWLQLKLDALLKCDGDAAHRRGHAHAVCRGGDGQDHWLSRSQDRLASWGRRRPDVGHDVPQGTENRYRRHAVMDRGYQEPGDGR